MDVKTVIPNYINSTTEALVCFRDFAHQGEFIKYYVGSITGANNALITFYNHFCFNNENPNIPCFNNLLNAAMYAKSGIECAYVKNLAPKSAYTLLLGGCNYDGCSVTKELISLPFATANRPPLLVILFPSSADNQFSPRFSPEVYNIIYLYIITN